MFFEITLGDVIGWIVTIISVGTAVSVTVKLSINNKIKKVNQSKSNVGGDQIAGDKIGGDKRGK